MKKIGKYEVHEKIGVGGFGEVFKGRDPYIKRSVAIKTCTSADQETRNRFFQEAEIAGKLNHRNITTVYDFGVEDSLPFLIQEYLSGEDLDRKIKRRDDIPYPEKLLYLIQIARGLAYAHRHGVIHRDIKPANIRILEDGTVKIMDFGIAKLAQQETQLTRTGMTVGTAAYLPPEQIRGEPVDHRTDVFSFGVLAYELMAFARPFQGEQISAVIYEILNREPRPIREAWPAAPPEVVELIARCLAKDPADRFPDGAAILAFLEALQKKGRGRPPGEPPEGPPLDRVPAKDPETLETQELPQQPAAPPAPPLPSAPPAAPAGRRPPTIDDLELSSVHLHPSHSPRTVPVRGAAAARRSSPVRWVALVLLPLLALAAGWGLGDERWRGQFFDYLAAMAGRERPDETGAEAGETATDETAGKEALSPGDAGPPPPAVDAAAEPAGVDATPAAPVPPEPPPAPPPPPEPEPGRVVVTKVDWSERLTVRVGRGRRYPLTRDRNFPLPPGTYSFVFELQEPEYQASETVRVVIRENERTNLESPIRQPGALTVRAGLGKPQGKVLLSGTDLGSTPISRQKTAPGEYRIRILPLGGAGGGIEQGVVILPGQETVLTFDLDVGDVSDRVKPLESR